MKKRDAYGADETPGSATPSAEPPERKDDVVLLHSPTEDGAGVRVLRAREGRIEAGEVRPLQEGKPIAGDVVTLKPREGAPRVCDVEVLHAHEPARPRVIGDAPARGRPKQVATDAYREEWERIFGKRQLS